MLRIKDYTYKTLHEKSRILWSDIFQCRHGYLILQTRDFWIHFEAAAELEFNFTEACIDKITFTILKA